MAKLQIDGQRFGKLLVLGKSPAPAGSTSRKSFWECRCDCGAIRVVEGATLRSGNVLSCKKCKPTRLIDLTGKRFGKLVVLKRAGYRGVAVLWLCQCDCGKQSTPAGNSLREGTSTSCGCVRRELVKTHAIKHGYYTGGRPDREYNSYLSAINRCRSPRNKDWHNYGARGIKFLFYSFDEWKKELGPRPEGMTVDRIDNDGNYEPGNVRWATAQVQIRGRKRDEKNQWKNENRATVINFD